MSLCALVVAPTFAQQPTDIGPAQVTGSAVRLDEVLPARPAPCPFGLTIESNGQGGYQLLAYIYDGDPDDDPVLDLDYLEDPWLWTPTVTLGVDCSTAAVRGSFNTFYVIDLETDEAWSSVYEEATLPVTWFATVDGYVTGLPTTTGWDLRRDGSDAIVIDSFTTSPPPADGELLVDVSAEGRHLVTWQHTDAGATSRVYHLTQAAPVITVIGGQHVTVSPSGNVVAYERPWSERTAATRIMVNEPQLGRASQQIAVHDLPTGRIRAFDLVGGSHGLNLLDDGALFGCGDGQFLLDLDDERLVWNIPGTTGATAPTTDETFCRSLLSSP